MSIFRKIATKALVLFVVNVILWVSLLGVLFYFLAARSLESQVDTSLKSTASVLASQWDGSVLLAFHPGMESTALYRSLSERLKLLKDRTQVDAITIATPTRKSILSGDSTIQIGQPVPRLDLIQDEVAGALQGRVSASKLVTVHDKQYKSAVAPIYSSDKVVAVLVVDMSPAYLTYLRSFRNSLFLFTGIALLCCALSARLFSRGITEPISGMAERVKEIGEARYERPLEIRGADELSMLAESIEAMRKNILRRDTQLRMMLSGIAHEIRNPLGGMELFAGILEKEGLSSRDLEYVKKIKSEIQNLKRLLNEFLEFAGPKKMVYESFEMDALISEIRDMMDQELREKQIHWTVDASPKLAPLSADRSRLKQALLNLYRNASQAVHHGGEIVSRITQHDAVLSLEISNTQQLKLPSEIGEKLFEPFYTTKEKGIGLGLPMAKQVVEAHGGTLEVSENSDTRITFLLRLPAFAASKSGAPEQDATDPARLPLHRSQSA